MVKAWKSIHKNVFSLLLKGEEYGLACGLSLAVTAGWQKPLPVDRHGLAAAARHGAAAAAHSPSATRGTPPLHPRILHTSRSSLPAPSLSLPLQPACTMLCMLYIAFEFLADIWELELSFICVTKTLQDLILLEWHDSVTTLVFFLKKHLHKKSLIRHLKWEIPYDVVQLICDFEQALQLYSRGRAGEATEISSVIPWCQLHNTHMNNAKQWFIIDFA